ncbi:uncharacterized protein EV422DRAFT_333430 [Fimicolochytrium jonesii]|uniref:uncharacterized protein n=1 Tax=Fimicolochytrium jonesii TaxID=1396493 RepID=UPI0022FE33DF|nr:uncharacterized protein EV422DRAFT_333430 [Fimicolochytrium jonesii]KAI8816101.1 hypothetical protein EV422DRAFT_333430 [Fimicolochytrium jonesii]
MIKGLKPSSSTGQRKKSFFRRAYLGDFRQIILQFFDLPILRVQHLLQPSRQARNRGRVQIRRLEDLIHLQIPLLDQVPQRLDLLLQHQVLETCLLLHADNAVHEPFIQLITLLLDLPEPLLQHLVFPRQCLVPVLENLQPGLGVPKQLLVLVVVLQLPFECVAFRQSSLQRLRQPLVLRSNIRHLLLIPLLLLLHILHLLLQRVDQRQVVQRDIVIVVLDLPKRLVVILHQRIDLPILALLDLMHLVLALQLQIVPHNLHLLLVFGMQLLCPPLKVVAHARDLLVVLLLEVLDDVLVGEFELLQLEL